MKKYYLYELFANQFIVFKIITGTCMKLKVYGKNIVATFAFVAPKFACNCFIIPTFCTIKQKKGT